MRANDKARNSNGLLYRYGNKSRRKVAQIFIALAILSMPLTCDGEDKIVRVDPLGRFMNYILCANKWKKRADQRVKLFELLIPIFFVFTYPTVFLKLLHKATKNVSISQIANINIHHLLKLKFNKTDISYNRLWKSLIYAGRKKHVGSKKKLSFFDSFSAEIMEIEEKYCG